MTEADLVGAGEHCLLGTHRWSELEPLRTGEGELDRNHYRSKSRNVVESAGIVRVTCLARIDYFKHHGYRLASRRIASVTEDRPVAHCWGGGGVGSRRRPLSEWLSA